MRLIVCIDERRGIAFNGRRQSRDRAVCMDIAKDLRDGERLLLSEYSRPLFEGICPYIICRDDFLDAAKEGDSCFAENSMLAPYAEKADSIVLYHWNRHYPSDMTFDIDLEKEGFMLYEVKEFVGNSHEKITKETYKR